MPQTAHYLSHCVWVAYLKTMNSHPPIHTTQHALRFGDLPPGDFERLCLGLLQSESGEWQQVQHYGQAGNDQGRDLLAQRHGQRWVVQCKRYQTLGAQTLKVEVDKCHALDAVTPGYARIHTAFGRAVKEAAQRSLSQSFA